MGGNLLKMRCTGVGVAKKEDLLVIGATLAEDADGCALVEPLSSNKSPLPPGDMIYI